jgi:hypothetical protein
MKWLQGEKLEGGGASYTSTADGLQFVEFVSAPSGIEVTSQADFDALGPGSIFVISKDTAQALGWI